MKKYQITEKMDWFSQKEVIEIIKNMKEDEKFEIIKLNGNKPKFKSSGSYKKTKRSKTKRWKI